MSKKLIIGKENFIEQDAFDPNYYVRFRVITDDQNKFSYWSPIFSVTPQKQFIQGNFSIPGRIIAEKAANYATIAWDAVGIYKYVDSQYTLIEDLDTYDLWIQFGSNSMTNAGPWIHKERLSTTSVNVIVPSQYSYFDTNGVAQTDIPRQMKIEVHRPVRPITRYSPNRTIFTQDTQHIDLTNDTIRFDSNHHLTTGEAVGYYLYNAASAALPLTDGAVYWARIIDPTKITLHPSANDATNNTNKINLTSAGQGAGVFVRNPFPQNSTTVNVTTNKITLPFNHGFSNGDPVIYNAATVIGGLVKETLYWVKVYDATTISLHSNKAGSLNSTSIVDFTTTGSGYGSLALLPSLLYKASVAI